MLCLFILSLTSAQQNTTFSIKGRVIDNETGLPMENVNVFLTNTTIGTATGKNGEFIIKNVPPGTYDIIFSYVGFEMQKRNVKADKNETLTFNISLRQKIINLSPVEITGKASGEWEDNLKLFTNIFIGETDNSDMTKILNPEDINFTEAKNSDILRASADSVLIIENKSLGYMIYVILDSFSYNRSDNSIKYVDYSRFRELIPESADEKTEWEENRQKTYLDSPRYFFYQLVHKQLYKNVYVIYQGTFNELRYRGGTEVKEDDLNVTTNKDSTNYILNFSGSLKIEKRYTSEKSILTFYNPVTEIDEYGNFLKPFYTVEIYGYWSKQGLADLLPKNYVYTGD